jgi:hypothetical protein
MKAIVVTDQAAGTAGMKLVQRPEPQGRRSPASRARITAMSLSRFMRRDSLGKDQSVSEQERMSGQFQMRPQRRNSSQVKSGHYLTLPD